MKQSILTLLFTWKLHLTDGAKQELQICLQAKVVHFRISWLLFDFSGKKSLDTKEAVFHFYLKPISLSCFPYAKGWNQGILSLKRLESVMKVMVRQSGFTSSIVYMPCTVAATQSQASTLLSLILWSDNYFYHRYSGIKIQKMLDREL